MVLKFIVSGFQWSQSSQVKAFFTRKMNMERSELVVSIVLILNFSQWITKPYSLPWELLLVFFCWAVLAVYYTAATVEDPVGGRGESKLYPLAMEG